MLTSDYLSSVLCFCIDTLKSQSYSSVKKFFNFMKYLSHTFVLFVVFLLACFFRRLGMFLDTAKDLM